MREVKGQLWDYYGRPDTIILITTNGFVKNNGECVMGRGCAKEAVARIPGVARKLGELIRRHGNNTFVLEPDKVWSFPVKHVWWEEADPVLITASSGFLRDAAVSRPDRTFVLPRPGCGNGHLKWENVKPLLENLPDNVLVISFF